MLSLLVFVCGMEKERALKIKKELARLVLPVGKVSHTARHAASRSKNHGFSFQSLSAAPTMNNPEFKFKFGLFACCQGKLPDSFPNTARDTAGPAMDGLSTRNIPSNDTSVSTQKMSEELFFKNFIAALMDQWRRFDGHPKGPPAELQHEARLLDAVATFVFSE